MFLHYNNYYNRKLKIEYSLDDYSQYSISHRLAPEKLASSTWTNVSFNPNDGVNTIITVNWFGEHADYCVISEDGTTIDSRWFILEATRNLKGQYDVLLKRDVLADYYSHYINIPSYIERGIARPTDPVSFTPENVELNQIKVIQEPLYDSSGCPWVVIYYGKDLKSKIGTNPIKWESKPEIDYEVDSLEEYDYFKYTNPHVYNFNELKVKWYTELGMNIHYYEAIGSQGYTEKTYTANTVISLSPEPTLCSYSTSQSPSNIKTFTVGGSTRTLIPTGADGQFYGKLVDRIFENQVPLYEEGLRLCGASYVSDTTLDFLKKENGKIIYDTSTSKYYKISLERGTDRYDGLIEGDTVPEEFNTAAQQAFDDFSALYINNQLEYTYQKYWRLIVEHETIRVVLNEVQSDSFEMEIVDNAKGVSDAPYNIMAIPAGAFKFRDKDGETKELTKDMGYQMALDLGAQISSGSVEVPVTETIDGKETTTITNVGLGQFIYDVQLVPYISYEFPDGEDIITHTDDGKAQYIYKAGTEQALGIVYNITKSQFEKSIDTTVKIYPSSLSPKFFEACFKVRLNSPNYSSIYEFSPAKTGSVKDSRYCAGPFRAYCTLKPYSPYIQVWPEVYDIAGEKSLYGGNYLDARGLICSGDFSITTLNSAWTDYVINNKNYNEIFNREIDKMEVDYELQKERSIIGMTTSAVGSAIGIGASVATGNVVGALSSGAGGLLGIGSSVAQLATASKQFNENVRYAQDMHMLQLGSVKAKPNTVSRISGININNLGVPILEIYECTQLEKLAFANKIKYDGMTIGKIGTIGEYILPYSTFKRSINSDELPIIIAVVTETECFIKATPIRMETLMEDTHIADEIADELSKGFYIDYNDFLSYK